MLLDTTAIPEWIPVVNREAPADVSKWAKGERTVREAVADTMPTDTDDSFRTGDVSDALAEMGHSMTPRHIRRVLKRHAERGLLRKERDPDDGRRWVWVDTGLVNLSADAAAVVVLPTLSTDGGDRREQTTDILRMESYTGNVRIFPSPNDADAESSEAIPDGGHDPGGSERGGVEK